jgi:sodium transport system ATP-binding protein
MIQVTALRKTFLKGTVVAVDSVSFRAPDGRITGLLGPNGAGKTTTMRMIYGAVRPDSGTALLDGHDVTVDPHAVRRAIGVLPDARGLYPRLTAREHLRYFGNLHGLKGPVLEARIDGLIARLGLGKLADRRVFGFSQGERAKVAIGRALVHEPKNVLLDEPTNGLDVMSTRAMRELVASLRDEGRTVLFSSHIMQEVAALCDHVVVIARGGVVAEGSPDELVAQTGASNLEDAFVAAIGSTEGLQG